MVKRFASRLAEPSLSTNIPKSGVKFIVFLQIGPKIDICS
jgi:hypothetical protein